jgi:hypothetical protein
VKVAGILKGMDGKPMPDTEICYQTEPMIRAGENTLQVARSDKDGHFIMLAPPGRVKIMPVKDRVLGKTVMITASVFTSGRDVVVDMTKAFADDGHTQSNTITEYVRVIGPDGVAVPRPILQEESAGKTMFQPASGLDGMVGLRGDKGTQVKLTSPFLKKPVLITLQESGKVAVVRFDTKQTILPTTAEWAEATGAGFG